MAHQRGSFRKRCRDWNTDPSLLSVRKVAGRPGLPLRLPHSDQIRGHLTQQVVRVSPQVDSDSANHSSMVGLVQVVMVLGVLWAQGLIRQGEQQKGVVRVIMAQVPL